MRYQTSRADPFSLAFCLVLALLVELPAADYFLDATGGSDSNNGTSIDQAWATLTRASEHNFVAGDRLLLKRGQTFPGSLDFSTSRGTEGNPVVVSSFGESADRPIIEAKGEAWAIDLSYSEFVEVENLELSGKGIGVLTWRTPTVPRADSHFHFRNLYIHDTTDTRESGGSVGTGIYFITNNEGAQTFRDIRITGCRFEDLEGYGITINKWAGGDPRDANEHFHELLEISNNTFTRLRDAGMQIGKTRYGLIRGNTVTDPGYGNTGTGSGLWTWLCLHFTIERNTFIGARGETDSCGVHIDIGCVNNIVQYNLSIDCEGGFQEILGLSRNCVYRYNVSINDGRRVVGVNGARSEGRTLYLGGYTGRGNPQAGPYYSYIYNNTIFVSADIVSKYEMRASANSALFANNIIHVAGDVKDVRPNENATNILFRNNLVHQSKVPATPFNEVIDTIDADPQFVSAGGLDATDYEPLNKPKVVDQSLVLYRLEGDDYGVMDGYNFDPELFTNFEDERAHLKADTPGYTPTGSHGIITPETEGANFFSMTEDFLGNPIVGDPDLGAIEIYGLETWLTRHGFASNTDPDLDPNNDGVTLLAAYALNLDPNRNQTGQLPAVVFNHTENTAQLEFFGEASGISYQVLKSNDLESWETLDASELSHPDNTGSITATAPVPEDLRRVFLRLFFRRD